MNILMLNNSAHLGGDTKCILNLSKSLIKENKVIIASSGGVMEGQIKKMGFKYYKINNIKSKNIFTFFKNIKKLINLINQEEIDVIHSHHRMTTLLAKVASKVVKVKVIHTQHSCINDKFNFTKLALRNIDIIAVSNAVRDILINKYSLKKSKITTIYNGIEIVKEEKKIDENLCDLKKNGYFIVAQVGRLAKAKGIYDFINIAENIKEKNSKIKFVLIGEGEEKQNIKNYILRKNLCEDVILLGSKSNVQEHLKYVDLVLLCSYVEGLPLTPIEAFSQHIPVIATNINGSREVVADNKNGFLVPVKSIEQFSSKILLLYDNKKKYEEFKIMAYQSYINKFDYSKYIDKHNVYYKKVLANH